MEKAKTFGCRSILRLGPAERAVEQSAIVRALQGKELRKSAVQMMVDGMAGRDCLAFTFTFKQYRKGWDADGFAALVKLDRNIVDGEARLFVKRVDRRALQSASRRGKRRLASSVVVEEGAVADQLHIHGWIERPSCIGRPDFEALVLRCFRKSAWADQQYRFAWSADEDQEGWARYVLKRGVDARVL